VNGHGSSPRSSVSSGRTVSRTWCCWAAPKNSQAKIYEFAMKKVKYFTSTSVSNIPLTTQVLAT
jgi:hypothetical protein